MGCYILLTILYIFSYCESVPIFNTNKHKHQNCFIECPKNQNCFNDLSYNTNATNSCNNLTIQAQYSSSLILKINQYKYPNLTIYLPSKSTSTNKIHIYPNYEPLLQNNQFNSNNIQLYCKYNKTSNQYTSSCILSTTISPWQCFDKNNICNKQIQMHHKHHRQLLALSTTIQPTKNEDSQTGFMKLLNQAKKINIIFYVIGGLILCICCVSCCCLYYCYRTHKAIRKHKKMSIAEPKSPISPSVMSDYNNTVATNSVQSPHSHNNEMVIISDEKETNNGPGSEIHEPVLLTIHGGSKRSMNNSILSMDVDDIELSNTTSKKSTTQVTSGIDYNNNNNNQKAFVINHNVNNNNYMPQQWQHAQQMNYMQQSQQSQQQQPQQMQHYVQKQSENRQQQFIQNHQYQQQPSHRNTITITNVNNNINRNNTMHNHHPHRNTVAVMTNIYNNNNYGNNNSGVQYQRNMHINVVPPKQSYGNNNNNNNNNNIPIPPPPPPIIKTNDSNLTPEIRVTVNDNASDITHITSSTLVSLNTEDFENDNSDSVSSSEILNNKHKPQITIQTYATHTETESGGEDMHNIIQPIENQLDDEKKQTVEHKEGDITEDIATNPLQQPQMGQLTIQNSGHSVDEDGGMYMKLQANFFQNNNESVMTLDFNQQPSPEHSQHSQHSPQNTMVVHKTISIDKNAMDVQKTCSYDSYQL